MEESGKIVQFKKMAKQPFRNAYVYIELNPLLAPDRKQQLFEIGWNMTSESKLELVLEDE